MKVTGINTAMKTQVQVVSLVGTFACLVAAGFSLNILTLFALVLAIGTVVDAGINTAMKTQVQETIAIVTSPIASLVAR